MNGDSVRPADLVGQADIVWVVLDTLRFDVARTELAAGRTPVLAGVLPPSGWEERHAPGTFTFASHQAFLAGFEPTPLEGPHERLFALRFAGSATTGARTAVFDAPSIPAGLASVGYRTVCIGGVGFFNPQHPLGSVLPGLFSESHWSPCLSVTDPSSTEHQVSLACELLDSEPGLLFLFINISAIHQPNCSYVPGAETDSIETHAAALRYVDAALAPLLARLRRRSRPTLLLLGSDHGTAYGEGGYNGHRVAHPVVTHVPWSEVVL